MKNLKYDNHKITLKKSFFSIFPKNILAYICVCLFFANCDAPSFSSAYSHKDSITKQKSNEKLSQKEPSTNEKLEKKNEKLEKQEQKNQQKSIKKQIVLKDFFEKYIKPGFKNSKIINYSPRNGFLAFEESSLPNSEISAMVYGNLALWLGEKRDIVGFFYYALVEGSANLQMENMFFYDANGKNITKEVLDIELVKKEMKKAIPERKTKGFKNFNDFFLEIPENGTKIIFQLTNGEKLAEGDKIFANFLTMDFNKKTGKFFEVPDLPEE